MCRQLIHAELHHQKGERQSKHHLGADLDDLGDSGREHIALTLVVAAIDRHQTPEEDRRRQRHHRIDGIGRLDDIDIHKAHRDHQHKTSRAHDDEERLGGLVDLSNVAVTLLSDTLRNQSRYRQRKARRRECEQGIIYLIGVVQKSCADAGKLVSEARVHTGKHNLEHHAEQFDNNHADAHDHSAF